jgi:hypothetical protein
MQNIARELKGGRNREDVWKRKKKNVKEKIYLKARQVGKRRTLPRDIQKISTLFVNRRCLFA